MERHIQKVEEKAMADPEYQALAAERGSIILSDQFELYVVEPSFWAKESD